MRSEEIVKISKDVSSLSFDKANDIMTSYIYNNIESSYYNRAETSADSAVIVEGGKLIAQEDGYYLLSGAIGLKNMFPTESRLDGYIVIADEDLMVTRDKFGKSDDKLADYEGGSRRDIGGIGANKGGGRDKLQYGERSLATGITPHNVK